MPNEVQRRRSPRVSAANHPHLPPAVLDVSLGGLAVELPEALPSGAIHDIAMEGRDKSWMVLRTRVAYSRPESRPDGRLVFVTGLAFLRDVTEQVSIERLRLAS